MDQEDRIAEETGHAECLLLKHGGMCFLQFWAAKRYERILKAQSHLTGLEMQIKKLLVIQNVRQQMESDQSLETCPKETVCITSLSQNVYRYIDEIYR